MWVTKLKLFHEDCPIVNRCGKFGITVLSYPRSHYKKKGVRYATTICKAIGTQEKINEFLIDLKKDKKITRLEISGDVFMYEYNLGTKHGEHVMIYFDPEMVFVKPTVNSPDGHEYWEVASWNKKRLTQFITDLSKHMDYSECLGIKQVTNVEVYFPSAMPKLSKAQERAILLAYQWGYYEYPRKVDLKDLAKRSDITVATFQENLRKAENKLIPMLMERIVKK